MDIYQFILRDNKLKTIFVNFIDLLDIYHNLINIRCCGILFIIFFSIKKSSFNRNSVLDIYISVTLFNQVLIFDLSNFALNDKKNFAFKIVKHSHIAGLFFDCSNILACINIPVIGFLKSLMLDSELQV